MVRGNNVKAGWLLLACGILSLLIPASVFAASFTASSLKGSYGFSGAKAGLIVEGPIYMDCTLGLDTAAGTGTATCEQVPASMGGTIANSATHGNYTGVLTFDGNGNLSVSGTFNENGVVSSLAASGSYTVNSDGTGNLTASTFSASFVIVSGGNEILFSRTTSGKGPQLGVAIKQ